MRLPQLGLAHPFDELVAEQLLVFEDILGGPHRRGGNPYPGEGLREFRGIMRTGGLADHPVQGAAVQPACVVRPEPPVFAQVGETEEGGQLLLSHWASSNVAMATQRSMPAHG